MEKSSSNLRPGIQPSAALHFLPDWSIPLAKFLCVLVSRHGIVLESDSEPRLCDLFILWNLNKFSNSSLWLLENMLRSNDWREPHVLFFMSQYSCRNGEGLWGRLFLIVTFIKRKDFIFYPQNYLRLWAITRIC